MTTSRTSLPQVGSINALRRRCFGRWMNPAYPDCAPRKRPSTSRPASWRASDDHEEHENEEHIDDDHKDFPGKRRRSRPRKVGGLKGLLTHGNTRDAGMAIYPSLEDASFTAFNRPAEGREARAAPVVARQRRVLLGAVAAPDLSPYIPADFPRHPVVI